jgi:glycosyltransferase involved in cell wall biosynthesis
MKILVLTDRYPTHNARGGAGTVAARLASGFEGSGHDVTVVTTKQERATDPGDDGQVTIEAVYAPHCPRFRAYYGIYNPSTVTEVGDFLDAYDPDVVHAHNVHEFLSYHTLKLAARRQIPTVLTFHDAMSITYGKLSHFVDETHDPKTRVQASAYRVGPRQRLRQGRTQYFPLRTPLVRRYVDRYVDRRIAVSRALRSALVTNGMPCDTVVHNGIDVDRFATGNPDAFRERFELGDARVILHGGRVGHMKGSGQLATVFGRLADQLENLKLVVTGETDGLAGLRDRASPHGDRIVEAGWISDDSMRDAYHAATVVATPSLYLDPFPTVNLEAMAAGTPVVTTCFGGGREVMVDGETGVVTNPLDTEHLAEALREVLVDSALRARLGNAARERIRSSFRLSQQVGSYFDCFEEVFRSTH